jgi:FkbM family methyltransferase
MNDASSFNTEAQIPLPLMWLRRLGTDRGRIRGRDRLLSWLVPVQKRTFFPFEVDFYGLRYRGNLNNIVDWFVFFYGSPAKSELAILERLVHYLRRSKSELHFADIGTNVGVHALFMSRLVDSVLGFEPVPYLWADVQEKIRLNKLENVQVMNCGLGTAEDRLPLYLPAGANLGNGSMVEGFTATNSADPISVEVRRGDSVFGAEERRFDIVKIDVEGFELEVCAGLRETLRRNRPAVLLELSGFNARKFTSQQDFLDRFYPGAVVRELTNQRHNGAYYLEPYDVVTDPHHMAELLILPKEHADFLELYSHCRCL